MWFIFIRIFFRYVTSVTLAKSSGPGIDKKRKIYKDKYVVSGECGHSSPKRGAHFLNTSGRWTTDWCHVHSRHWLVKLLPVETKIGKHIKPQRLINIAAWCTPILTSKRRYNMKRTAKGIIGWLFLKRAPRGLVSSGEKLRVAPGEVAVSSPIATLELWSEWFRSIWVGRICRSLVVVPANIPYQSTWVAILCLHFPNIGDPAIASGSLHWVHS